MTPATAPAIRRSPLSRAHGELGASLEREAGWDLPTTYGDEAGERETLRRSVAIADITPRGKVDARGDIEPALGAATGAVVAAISPQWGMALTGPGDEEVLLPKMESASGPGAMITDATHLFAGFALGGPGLADLLARSTAWDPSTLAPGAATGAPIAEVRAIMVRREGVPSILEVYVSTELARYVWETLLGVAQGLDGGAVGWNALRAEGWS